MQDLAENILAARLAGSAIQNACDQIGYICAFSGEIACQAYSGTRRQPITSIEVKMLIPGVKPQNRPTIDAVKRAIAGIKPQPFTKFSISQPSPSSVNLTVAGTEGDEEKWHLPVEITIPSDSAETDVQPLEFVNGLRCVCREYLLLTRLALWYYPPISGLKANDVQHLRRNLQINDINPLLQSLVESNSTITKRHLRGYNAVVSYCKANPNSAALWQKVGFTSDDPTFSAALSLPTDKPGNEAAATTPTIPYNSLPLSLDPPPYQVTALPISGHLEVNRAPSEAPLLDERAAFVSGLTPLQMVCMAARDAIVILDFIGFDAAVFGSVARFMYGSTRSPTAVDILLLPHFDGRGIRTIEDVKTGLAEHDPERFFRDSEGGVYYHLPSRDTSVSILTACRVNLSFSGTLIPCLPLQLINWAEGLPLIPFPLLLLQTLQAWHQQTKEAPNSEPLARRTNADDVIGLFELKDLIQALEGGKSWANKWVFPQSFLEASAMRVRAFCSEYPATSEDWRSVGFHV